MEGTNLVGWDFAITDQGVDLIEGNPGASYIVAQIPNVEENIGIADKMVYPYLEASITGMGGWKTWIEALCEKTGWSRDTASDNLQKAKEKGVSPYSYLKNECWRFTENEISEFAEWTEKLQEKRRSDREYYINIVCEKAGWTKEFARNRMNAAKNRGYSFRKFITMALWKLSDSEFDKLEPLKTPEKVQGKVADGGTDHSDSEIVDSQSLIMKEMNWSFGRLKIEALKSKVIAGANFNEFYTYKLYRHPAEKGREFITEEVHLKLQLRYCDYQGNEKYFDNKILFCKTFKDFIGRRWFETKDISFEQFQEKTKNFSSIIAKKINGLGGKGIKKYNLNHSEENDREIYNSLMTEEYIVEEYIEQHPAIAEFEPDTLNTIRIMSMNIDGNCKILNAVIKLGTGDIVDNMIAGNSYAAGIDVDTGIICTDGVNKNGEVATYHVNSGKRFRGFQIPCWEMLIETVKKASNVVECMPYIGWDVAVKSNGEIAIIEGNHNQAGFLVQYPFAISEGIGKRDTVKPYWEFNEL